MLWSWRWSRDSLYGRQTDLKLQATYLYVRLVLQSLTFSFWTVFDELYQKTPWLYQKPPFVFISRVDLIALTTTLAGLCCAVLTSEHLSCTSQRIGWLNGFQIYINRFVHTYRYYGHAVDGCHAHAYAYAILQCFAPIQDISPHPLTFYQAGNPH